MRGEGENGGNVEMFTLLGGKILFGEKSEGKISVFHIIL